MRQSDLADLSHCSRPMISFIEGGRRHASRALLRRVLDSLSSCAKRSLVADVGWWAKWKALSASCAMRWTQVEHVETVSYEYPYVYDLSVPGPETFYGGGGGLFVHNTFAVAKVIEAVQRSTLVLAPNKTLAAQLYGEFKEFFPHNAVEYFVSYYDYYQPEAYVPSSDTYIEKDSSVNSHIEQMRLSATKAIIERRDTIIVASVSAIYGLGDPGSYLKMVMHLDRGDRVDQRYILVRLAELQYTRNDMAFQRGSYRVRGDVIDVFPAESEKEADAYRAVRRRDREPVGVRSVDRRGDQPRAAVHDLPEDALRDAARANRRGGGRDQGRALRAAEVAERAQQARRSAAAGAAYAVRSRDDPRARLLQRHRKLLALSVGT